MEIQVGIRGENSGFFVMAVEGDDPVQAVLDMALGSKTC